MKFRQGPNGELIAPARGLPPECPKGYYADPGDKFVFLPLLVECGLRETFIDTSSSCCGPRNKLRCGHNGKVVTGAHCKVCLADPEKYWNDCESKDDLRTTL